MRNLLGQIRNQNTAVNNQGQGLAYMEALGYTSTADPANPSSISDAQYALNLLANLNTIGGVYYGTVQAGGSGGTGATLVNYDNILSPLWAGQ
jgi:hypothetical protein